MQNFLSVLNRYDPNILMVQDEYAKLKELSDNIKSQLNETTGNDITEELVKYDTRRDEAINGILSIVNGFTFSKDAALKKAGTFLPITWRVSAPALPAKITRMKPEKSRKLSSTGMKSRN